MSDQRRSVVPSSSPLLRRAGPPGRDGVTVRIDPASEPADLGGVGWQWVSFAAHQLEPGARLERSGDGQEVALVVLEGTLNVRVGRQRFDRLGGRSSVFEPTPATVVLAEAGATIAIEALTATCFVLAAAPAAEPVATRLIEPESILVEERGSGSTARQIRHLLPPSAPASRLILFEALTPGGNWSSYPPHKHDTEDQPRESRLEELYYHRFARPGGHAFQRVYSPDRSLDEAVVPLDGDVVLVPRGYHPVGSPPGYDGYYLNVMAGPTRLWHFSLDPDHAWLMNWDPAAPRG
ncbi:MAG: 5-deoxy-glucuronate isomerase [Candidatus Limnocylindrales bacterium]